ncbi:MAG: ABC-F family ATP-binding cassette domain-containing protein [Thermodesulfobacteriota bacterium]|nr:ABC-F family ATP-binding cassette domain-containing protein [Thermodesulfobacteriota bacterium]
MLQLKNIEVDYSGRKIFTDVNWHIRPGARIGLCGENGAGKSTLLKLLCGLIVSDKGDVIVAKGTTFGYLPQDGLHYAGTSLFEEVRSACSDLLSMAAEIERLEGEISVCADEKALNRYAHLQDLYSQRGGFTLDADIARVLHGLGFAEQDWDKPCEQFSGGWQMRIALARLLLQRPNLLLLDEPTNHLDLPARDWLENYLLSYPFAVVLVSHDRYFMDQVVQHIVEVWNGDLTEYPGNYTLYLQERDRRVAALRAAKQRQDEEIERVEAFINRFRYQANKASQVQSRIRQVEKIVRIKIPPQRKKIAFNFPQPSRSGKDLLELKQAGQRYGDNQVLSDVDLTVTREERIALIGANGAGKSTLMRLLAGIEQSCDGERIEGHNLELAYFAQDQAAILNQKNTVLEEITANSPVAMVPCLRNVLGTFLFSGDDVHKRVSVLSGGERNRLALAILLLRPANLMLLDEPTNHLDLQSKDVLLQALHGYTGTLVFVSHDRYFVDALASRIIDVEGGHISSHPGNYADFLRAKQSDGLNRHGENRVEYTAQAEVTHNVEDKEHRKKEHARRKEEQRQLQKLRRQLQQLEGDIEKKEQQNGELETQLADPDLYQDHERFSDISKKHIGLTEKMEELYCQWEQLQQKITDLEG